MNTLMLFAAAPTWLPSVLMIVAMIALMYFLMIRPQKKQRQEEAAMRDALRVGDEITTIGGIIGKIVSIKDETVVIETTRDRTKIRFLKTAIRNVDVHAEDALPDSPKKKQRTEEKQQAQKQDVQAETDADNTEAMSEENKAE